MSGCRPWIGVDDCHLRGLASGVLLTAVAMDPNNDPYPMAYAVVGVENKDSWEWFLQLLKEDLLIEREDVYTFMSDKQKGLIGTFDKVLPNVGNRFCVRHLHENMKRAGFKGHNFKKLLWRAVNATTVASFSTVMHEIEQVDSRCLEWLQKDKSATEWSKSHFSTWGKCDTLVNNMCEQFNSCILDAREKPILTMLEWIREYMMSRIQDKRIHDEFEDDKSAKETTKEVHPDVITPATIDNHETETEGTSQQNSTNRPTTKKGRQALVSKRAKMENKETKVALAKSTPYSVSSSINTAQPKGVEIRAPPPMSFHPQHFVGASVVPDATSSKGLH